jgi:hypothetical protein
MPHDDKPKRFTYIDREPKRKVMEELASYAEGSIAEFIAERKGDKKDQIAHTLKDEDFETIWFNECLYDSLMDEINWTHDYLEPHTEGYIERFGIMDSILLVKAEERNTISHSELLPALVRESYECRFKKTDKDRRKKVKPMTPLLKMYVDAL